MRIVVAGATVSTHQTLDALIRHGADVVGVLQLRGESSHTVTAFSPLDELAESHGIPCATFRNINDSEIVEQVCQWQPDLMFVVGLSQLVRDEMMSIPARGCVGFHPTFLPAGRGRAPLAWLTLDAQPGAATFFLIDEGVDSGPIFVQETFEVTPEDYASDVGHKLVEATGRALDRWLPELLTGVWNPQPQDEILATYNGRRSLDDGLLDWHQASDEIHSLIRAASTPHPGAYTWYQGRKLIVWRAEFEKHLPWRGAVGRVLHLEAERGALVQTGDGLLWLTHVQFAEETEPCAAESVLKVGVKLGFVVQDEVAALRMRVDDFEARLSKLENHQ
ncbi:MAG: methionyl-tRNA formyltransferase [Planctomycetaceae bacterium]|jgi:methionyl-tRNA formyltransferase